VANLASHQTSWDVVVFSLTPPSDCEDTMRRQRRQSFMNSPSTAEYHPSRLHKHYQDRSSNLSCHTLLILVVSSNQSTPRYLMSLHIIECDDVSFLGAQESIPYPRVVQKSVPRTVSPLFLLFPSPPSITDEPLCLNDQQSFLLNMKICFLYVKRTKQKVLQSRIRALVNHCTIQNRKGNPDYIPLQGVVRRKLRALLGDDKWTKTRYILHKYCEARKVVLTD